MDQLVKTYAWLLSLVPLAVPCLEFGKSFAHVEKPGEVKSRRGAFLHLTPGKTAIVSCRLG